MFRIVLLLFLFWFATSPMSAGELTINQPVTASISGGQEHTYSVSISANHSAIIVLEQQEVDLMAEVVLPGGTILMDINEEPRIQHDERFEIIAERSGVFGITVRPRSKSEPQGRYVIKAQEGQRTPAVQTVLFEARKLEHLWRQSMRQGHYAQARSFGDKALELLEAHSLTDHMLYVRWLDLHADYYDKEQNYARSISLLEKALPISERILGKEHPLTLLVQTSLARILGNTNDVSKAEPLAARALELMEHVLGKDHHLVAVCLFNLGVVTGDITKKEALYKRAVEIAERTFGPDDPAVGTMLNQLAIYYIFADRYQEAEHLLLRVEAINRQLGPAHTAVVANLMNLGLIARNKKDYEMAEEKYLKAIAIVDRTFGPENSRLAMILNNLANIYRVRGDYAKSLEAHHRVLRVSEATRGPYHPLTMFSLGNIAKTYAAQGDIEKAIEYQARVDRVVERNIQMNLAVGSERQKLSYLQGVAERLDRTISLHTNLAPGRATASELALLAVMERKGRVLDAMSESFAVLRQRAVLREQDLLKHYGNVTTELARLVLDGPDRITFEEHQKIVKGLEVRKEQLEEEISRRSAEFRSKSQPVTLQAIRNAIPNNGVLIEFVVYRPFDPKAESNQEAYGRPRYVAYVLHGNGQISWRDLGPATEINQDIYAFRKALRDPQRKDIRTIARAIDAKLMQPLRGVIGDATHLLVSPDGALNLIPFEALVDEQNQFLIKRFAFSYLTSGRDLLRLAVERESKTAIVILANPQFGEPNAGTGGAPPAGRSVKRGLTTASELSDVYFAPLLGTAQEAKEIRSLFPQASVLTGDRATESSLKKISGPRILHIATHGFFLSDGSEPAGAETRSIKTTSKIENPLMRSGLALAGANLQETGRDDGILTALEASGLNLWGTRLVTLSACDTGVGQVQYGQGVYGLRRAFLLAGTETIVMSLWPVSDFITLDLMAGYYQGLKKGFGRGEALRRMQLGLLGNRKTEHPFYWAGFIQSGQWKPLDE